MYEASWLHFDELRLSDTERGMGGVGSCTFLIFYKYVEFASELHWNIDKNAYTVEELEELCPHWRLQRFRVPWYMFPSPKLFPFTLEVSLKIFHFGQQLPFSLFVCLVGWFLFCFVLLVLFPICSSLKGRSMESRYNHHPCGPSEALWILSASWLVTGDSGLTCPWTGFCCELHTHAWQGGKTLQTNYLWESQALLAGYRRSWTAVVLYACTNNFMYDINSEEKFLFTRESAEK